MAPKGFAIGLTAVGLALGAAVWAAKPARTSGNDAASAASGSAATFYKDVLPIVQDLLDESNETLTLTIIPVTAGATTAAPATTTLIARIAPLLGLFPELRARRVARGG